MESKPLFLFASGAGANSSHPWMKRWQQQLASIGEVRLFDYPYMRAGRRRPDPLPLLIRAHREAAVEARRQTSGSLILIGKSMGSRIGCHVANEEKVDALVCLGYPLCGAGDRTKLRDKVLRALATPILFVQGTRDALCPLDLLEEVRQAMRTSTVLHVVKGGDHSLLVGKREIQAQGTTQEAIDQGVLEAIKDFLVKTGAV